MFPFFIAEKLHETLTWMAAPLAGQAQSADTVDFALVPMFGFALAKRTAQVSGNALRMEHGAPSRHCTGCGNKGLAMCCCRLKAMGTRPVK